MASGHQEQILVVEDDPKLARLTGQLLETFGYQVEVAGRGMDALVGAAERHPNLVLLDLMLPDMDGYEVCRQLRQLYHASVMPIVIVTAKDQPVDQLRGIASGANAYLRKPFDSTELVKTVVTLLEQAEMA